MNCLHTKLQMIRVENVFYMKCGECKTLLVTLAKNPSKNFSLDFILPGGPHKGKPLRHIPTETLILINSRTRPEEAPLRKMVSFVLEYQKSLQDYQRELNYGFQLQMSKD